MLNIGIYVNGRNSEYMVYEIHYRKMQKLSSNIYTHPAPK